MTLFLVLALCNGATSTSLTKTRIFRFFRTFVSSRSKFLGEMVNCTYCMTHWISLISVMIWRPRITYCGFAPLDYLVSVFAIVALSSIVSGIIYRLSTSPIIRTEEELMSILGKKEVVLSDS